MIKTIVVLMVCLYGACGQETKTPVAEIKSAVADAKLAIVESKAPQNVYLSAQPYIVSIEIRATLAAYSDEGTTYGTGSILDKDQGIILTNAHVAKSEGVIDHYDVTLFNGQVVQAQLLYTDPWHDFALLKVNPDDLKEVPASLPTIRNAVNLGEHVFIIGKNENKHFSMHEGTVANPFESTEVLSGQVFRISLNAQGGASGSPVFNSDGKVIGFIYASNGVTSAFAFPIDYALDALDMIKSKKKPTRVGTGVILTLTALEDLVRHDGLAAAKAEELKRKYPLSFSRVLTVSTSLVDSPASKHFKAGDIIVKVNDQEVGPSLYKMDLIINAASADKTVKFDIIRHGKEMTLAVETYNLHEHMVKRMLNFGKAVFYEADDMIVRRTGAPRGVFVSNLKPGGGFFDQIPVLQRKNGANTGLVRIESVDGTPIKSLDDFVKIIPDLMKKRDFYITIRNFGAEFGFNGDIHFSQGEQIKYIPYRSTDGLPELYTFNDDKHVWELKVIQ